MPLIPRFHEAGDYLQYYGPNINDPVSDPEIRFRFIRLLVGEAPLRYPFYFSPAISVDTVASTKTFGDLDPAVGHLYEAFLGVSAGSRYRISAPFDERLLKWDQLISDIQDDRTGVLTYEESPSTAPMYIIWIPPGKQFPGIAPQNNTQELMLPGKTITPFVIFIATRWTFQEVSPDTEPEIFDMLTKHKIPSTPIRFGHTTRVTPR